MFIQVIFYRIIFLLGFVLTFTSVYAQEVKSKFKIYSVQKGVGFDEIEFFNDGSFIQSGAGGLIKTVIDQGYYEQVDDTLFFTFTYPRIINNTDTFTNEGHYKHRKDTLYCIDSMSYCSQKDCLTPLYKVAEKRYSNGGLFKTYKWYSKEGAIDVKGKTHYVNDILIAHGYWTEYYPNGLLKEIILYQNNQKNGIQMSFFQNGKLKNKGEWLNSKKRGKWVYFDKYGVETIEQY